MQVTDPTESIPSGGVQPSEDVNTDRWWARPIGINVDSRSHNSINETSMACPSTGSSLEPSLQIWMFLLVPSLRASATAN